MCHAKGFDRLIKVCRQLKQKGLDFHLWILGEGENYNQLALEVEQSNMERTVEFLGLKENPYPYLKTADLFVLSSHHETMAYVVLEALILNKPIVSTDITGPRELLKDGLYGLLVENSEEGLYKGLEKMIADKELRESFTKNKRILVLLIPKASPGK